MVRPRHNNNNNGNKNDSINFVEFAKYVPLRLSTEERSLLGVLEQTLHVSEYTDHVDVTVARRGAKTRRILDGILEVCHIATGLTVASGKERSILRQQYNNCDNNGTTGSSSFLGTPNNKQTTTFRLNNSKGKSKKKKGSKKSKKKHEEVEEEDEPPQDNNNMSWASRDPKDNAALFQSMFEIGRRNKVLNPSSMRTTYGKLMYMLQDAQNPTVAKSLGFSLHKDLCLVAPYLEQYDAGELLQDVRLQHATRYIADRDPITGERLDRDKLERLVNEKRNVADELVREYSSAKLSPDDVRRCIDSIADAIVYVESNVAPVQTMLRYLEQHYDLNHVRDGFSLELRGSGYSSRGSYSTLGSSYSRYGLSSSLSSNSEGPKLSHSHATQYTFVWQSLRLWCKVMRNMHRLWICADDDLLSTSTSYHLHNTGQGLNRVQACPRVAKVMRSLLHATQQEAGSSWVGLSVIHLGDRDVPNALIFIDKYTQIPRFLNPLVQFVNALPELCQDERIKDYIVKEFGSASKLRMTVLTDYFKHGFDGSGDDGGSCIDGRLTSSWNWTSRLAKKSYYHAFMLSGFQGFDGDFK